MRRVALRGLFARKLRLVLTALAVALGVTLIAGTYVFTVTIKQGRKPTSADEVAIDASTAKRKHLEIGDKIAVVATAPRKDYTIVGTTQIAGVDSFGGATVVDMQLPEAQRMLGKKGFDQIQASAKPSVSPEQLRDELRSALPRSVEVRTGQEEARKQSSDIRDNLGFLTTALLVFAGISLFVGAFIIFNTFSITVTQRMREFALLRTLGASRGQVMRSVIGEGLTIGLLGSIVGLVLGLAVAAGLRALFRAVGIDLPSNGNVIASRTIIVSIVVGTVVTVLSSLAPALRATRVPPVEALREGAVPTTRGPSRKATVSGLLLGVVGVGLMAWGLFGSLSSSAALSLVGPGRIAVSKGYAEDHKVKAGDTLNLTTAVGRKESLRVTGIVDDKGGMVSALIVTNRQMVSDFGEPKDAFGMVGVAAGANQKTVQANVKRVLDRQFPEAEVLTAEEFKDDVAGQVDQLLSLIYALLALAVIVSLFGIVNTLVLSISERTRELG